LLREPLLGLLPRDDREDFNGFVPDVMEHPHFARAQAALGLRYDSQALDAALAHSRRFMSQMGFEGIARLRPRSSRQAAKRSSRLRGEDDLEPHSGQNLAKCARPNEAIQLSGLRGVQDRASARGLSLKLKKSS
jgi:hypothetical protein